MLDKDQVQSERKRAKFIIILRVKYRGWRDFQHVQFTGSPLSPVSAVRVSQCSVTALIPELQSHSNQSFN